MKLNLVVRIYSKIETFIIISKYLVGNAFLLNIVNIVTIK
ncbi:hypothetical protein HMPREF9391_0019 [Streptococcus sanguinis SK408]|uniref:Uncharacterized protein n=1 Tax=Streptococcus sanguinis SK408 TaxID=888818 RepID=F2CBZ1_STRSA|nr:hypothetical protein HMPREF9391_0019 [Streptococcus sanguinis SK408]